MRSSGNPRIRFARQRPSAEVCASVLVALALLVPSCVLPEVELVDDLPGGGRGGGRAWTGGRGGLPVGGNAGMGPSIGNSCDWNTGRCADLSCERSCPSTDGNYCRNACNGVLECVKSKSDCVTATDLVCAARDGSGRPDVCTTQWETAGGATTPMNSAAKNALALLDCLCLD
jgi:hypothetical protein